MNLTAILLLILVSTALDAHGYDRVTGRPFASRSEVFAPHGMAATSHPLATQIAIDVLKRTVPSTAFSCRGPSS